MTRKNSCIMLNGFLEADHVLDTQFRYISREVPRRYDALNLQQEKESIIAELQSRKNLFYIVLSCLLISHLLFINVYFKYKRTEKKYKKIAQDLIQSVNEDKAVREDELQHESVSQHLPVENTGDKPAKIISEDVVQTILKELEIFESKEQFLNKGITLGSLAKKSRPIQDTCRKLSIPTKGKILPLILMISELTMPSTDWLMTGNSDPTSSLLLPKN